MGAFDDGVLTTMERYARAVNSSDLSLRAEGFGDADVLLAAGYATHDDDRGRQALMLNRMLYSGDYARMPVMTAYAVRWVKSAMYRPGPTQLPRMQGEDVQRICHLVLRWWVKGVCPHCDGRRFELVHPDAQVTSHRACRPCGGTGRISLDDLAGKHVAAARWLASELDGLLEQVERDMRAALRSGAATADRR